MSYLGEMFSDDYSSGFMDEYLRGMTNGMPEPTGFPISQSRVAPLKPVATDIYAGAPADKPPQTYVASTYWPSPGYAGLDLENIPNCKPPGQTIEKFGSSNTSFLPQHNLNCEPIDLFNGQSLIMFFIFLIVILATVCVVQCARIYREVKKIRKHMK